MVALIDYGIGLTIVNKDNYDHEIFCINGSHSKNPKSSHYNEYFNFMIKCIKKGKLKQKELHKLADKIYGENN